MMSEVGGGLWYSYLVLPLLGDCSLPWLLLSTLDLRQVWWLWVSSWVGEGHKGVWWVRSKDREGQWERTRGDRLHQRWSLQGAQLGREEVLKAAATGVRVTMERRMEAREGGENCVPGSQMWPLGVSGRQGSCRSVTYRKGWGWASREGWVGG